MMCLRGRCASDHVAVTLSLCWTAKVGISAHRPRHILCLKTDTKLISSLSLLMWPTFNGKTQCSVVLETFSVATQKLSIALASSLSFGCSLSLILAADRKQGSVMWLTGVFFDTEHSRRMNCHFTRKQRERKPTSLHLLLAQIFWLSKDWLQVFTAWSFKWVLWPLYRCNSATWWCLMAACQINGWRFLFFLLCWPLFLSLPVRWSSWGNWTDGEERIIESIKATLPDAELALWATEEFGGGGRLGEERVTVHQQPC